MIPNDTIILGIHSHDGEPLSVPPEALAACIKSIESLLEGISDSVGHPLEVDLLLTDARRGSLLLYFWVRSRPHTGQTRRGILKHMSDAFMVLLGGVADALTIATAVQTLVLAPGGVLDQGVNGPTTVETPHDGDEALRVRVQFGRSAAEGPLFKTTLDNIMRSAAQFGVREVTIQLPDHEPISIVGTTSLVAGLIGSRPKSPLPKNMVIKDVKLIGPQAATMVKFGDVQHRVYLGTVSANGQQHQVALVWASKAEIPSGRELDEPIEVRTRHLDPNELEPLEPVSPTFRAVDAILLVRQARTKWD